MKAGSHALPEMPGRHDNRITRLDALKLVADFAGEVLERVPAGENEVNDLRGDAQLRAARRLEERFQVVRQVSQGFTGNSFNTLEFFHRVPAGRMRAILVAFIVLAFIVPVILVVAALATRSPAALWVACAAQFAGLFLERWFFLADSNHPQNLYYQNKA